MITKNFSFTCGEYQSARAEKPHHTTRTHTHVHTHTYTHTRTHTRTHTYLCRHVHAYTRTHVHTYTRTHVPTTYTRTHVHTHTHARARIHTCIHTPEMEKTWFVKTNFAKDTLIFSSNPLANTSLLVYDFLW